MPMPALDPTRFKSAVLADPSHKLPLPDKGGRLFLASGEVVDTWNAFYAHLLADGSLKLAPDEAAAPAKPAPAAEPGPDHTA